LEDEINLSIFDARSSSYYTRSFCLSTAWVSADKQKIADESQLSLRSKIREAEMAIENQEYQIKVQYSGGDDKVPTATVIIIGPDGSEVGRDAAASGNGPVNATCNAIERILGEHIELVDFDVHTVAPGHGAVGMVRVLIEHDGKDYPGSAEHTDTIIASARAVMNALNKRAAFDAVVKAHTV
jgi:2-isopropylmalate synthase